MESQRFGPQELSREPEVRDEPGRCENPVAA